MLSFVAASFVLVLLPGPDTAVITRNAISAGRRAGWFTMLGGTLGLGVHAAALAVGLSALLMASATGFTVLKVVGASYLAYLGVRALRRSGQAAPSGEDAAGRGLSPAQALRQGWLSNALNPKAAVFFVTFLPQFMTPDRPALPQSLTLMALFALVYVAWFTVLVTGVDRLGRWLRRPGPQRFMDRLTGVALLGFGARLAAGSR